MTKLPNLNRLLTLEERNMQSDGAGGLVRNWHEIGRHWANIRVRSGQSGAGETAPITRLSLEITVRASGLDSKSRPKPGQRFKHGARVFSINAVSDDGPTSQYITCFATQEETL